MRRGRTETAVEAVLRILNKHGWVDVEVMENDLDGTLVTIRARNGETHLFVKASLQVFVWRKRTRTGKFTAGIFRGGCLQAFTGDKDIKTYDDLDLWCDCRRKI